ncbi:hypothetical protein CN187_33385 [Sinorhizobium meliloti]|nr:hypothetical protein CN187_33385 [Sinorhizobium meliloti]
MGNFTSALLGKFQAALTIVRCSMSFVSHVYSIAWARGTVRNSVRAAITMERRESSHGYRERTLDQLLAGRDPSEVSARTVFWTI